MYSYMYIYMDIFFPCISGQTHEGVFGEIVARVVLFALLLITLGSQLIIGVTPEKKRQKSTMTHGPRCGEKWSRTPIQEVNCPMSGKEWSPHLIQISTPIPPIYRPIDLSRSISTVDHYQPTREYGRYRRSITTHLRRITVDRRSSKKYPHNFAVNLIDDGCDIHVYVYT